VQGTLGGLDVLINNAGIPGPAGPIETIAGAAWERTVAVNLHSHYYFARRAVPMLRRSGASPLLIAMGSIAGANEGAFRAACASTRWALVGLVQALAASSGPTASASTRSCRARWKVRLGFRPRRLPASAP
jgi:NAD(P)-dependent dehydrogenase (short-subunit alcohol dehydrogenase family)